MKAETLNFLISSHAFSTKIYMKDIIRIECWTEKKKLGLNENVYFEDLLPVSPDLSVSAELENTKTSKGTTAAETRCFKSLQCNE